MNQGPDHFFRDFWTSRIVSQLLLLGNDLTHPKSLRGNKNGYMKQLKKKQTKKTPTFFTFTVLLTGGVVNSTW